jgi:hypothetical protein
MLPRESTERELRTKLLQCKVWGGACLGTPAVAVQLYGRAGTGAGGHPVPVPAVNNSMRVLTVLHGTRMHCTYSFPEEGLWESCAGRSLSGWRWAAP